MEAIGQLTGGVAHDFNNLLMVIQGNLEALERSLPRAPNGDSDRLTRWLRSALRAVYRAAALTHRLLAFARQQPLAPESVDANKLVGSMSDLLRRTLGESIAIETVLAGGLWPTFAEPLREKRTRKRACGAMSVRRRSEFSATTSSSMVRTAPYLAKREYSPCW
jgi:signal transduction histidine kinase